LLTGFLLLATACGGGEVTSGAETRAEITADDDKFDKDRLVMAANTSVTVVFTNQQAIAHNFSVYRSKQATEVIHKGGLSSGPGTREEKFRSPAPGTYYFRCDVHAEMNGEFVTR
jgi:plastocyanin